MQSLSSILQAARAWHRMERSEKGNPNLQEKGSYEEAEQLLRQTVKARRHLSQPTPKFSRVQPRLFCVVLQCRVQ